MIWTIDLHKKKLTHRPTGLIIQFSHAMDGSGAMLADLLNPEDLPANISREEAAKLANLPNEAWKAYAEAAQKTFDS